MGAGGQDEEVIWERPPLWKVRAVKPLYPRVCLGGLRDHKVMGMRYYEYLSSAKVDMLFPQIDRSSKVTGTEIGISVKVLTFSRKTNGQEPPSVYEKLAEVEDWIYAHGKPVGTVDEKAAWIYGRMRLGMTVVPKGWERRDSPQVPLDGTVLFAGDSGDGACVVMGGSARHLHDLHALPVADAGCTRRDPTRTRWVSCSAAIPTSTIQYRPEEFAERPLQDRYHLIARPAKDILLAATGKGRRSPGGLDAGQREIEFLAKQLRTGISGRCMASLATPLFVARID